MGYILSTSARGLCTFLNVHVYFTCNVYFTHNISRAQMSKYSTVLHSTLSILLLNLTACKLTFVSYANLLVIRS